MSARSFLDTNVLVYSDDASEPVKRARAEALMAELWRTGAGVVSTQVLQEYFVATTRKLGVPADVARRRVELLTGFETVPIRPQDILAAIDLHRLHAISFWDALIVTSASISGCTVLYSEDLQPGRHFGDVRIVDPFA